MAELQEATQLLTSSPLKIKTVWAGDHFETQEEAHPLPSSPRSPVLSAPWAIPPHLLHAPATREVAAAAVASGGAAAAAPSSFDAVLQHGLNLQELVSRLSDAPADQLALLHAACEVYKRASDLQPGRTAVVLFNWAVALSDIARLARPHSADDAAQYLSTAAVKYAAAVAIDPGNPQALNNWALALQELAALAPQEEREALLYPAVARFRAAIRLQPDANLMSRFCYNLGTVLYSHACHLSDQLLGGGAHPPPASAPGGAAAARPSHSAEERRVRAAFAHAASYIVLAFALQPGVKVYEDSVRAVQRLLPLPYLRTGLLQVAAPGTAGTPEEAWVPAWFALDAYALHAVRPPPAEAARLSGAVPNVAVEVCNVTAAHVCRDPSLPAGWALWLGLRDRSAGMFLVAEEREEAEGWVDALRLLGVIERSEGGAERLQRALVARRPAAARPAAAGGQHAAAVGDRR